MTTQTIQTDTLLERVAEDFIITTKGGDALVDYNMGRAPKSRGNPRYRLICRTCDERFTVPRLSVRFRDAPVEWLNDLAELWVTHIARHPEGAVRVRGFGRHPVGRPKTGPDLKEAPGNA